MLGNVIYGVAIFHNGAIFRGIFQFRNVLVHFGFQDCSLRCGLNDFWCEGEMQ